MFSGPRRALLQLTLILVLGLSSCGSLFGTKATPTPTGPTATPEPPTATPEPLAATVNGQGITLSEFQIELAQYKSAQTALGKTVSAQDAGKAVLEDLISQELLAQAARAEGFDLSGSALQSRMEALASQLGGADKLAAWESGQGYTDRSFRVALRRSVEAAWMRDKIVNAVPDTADQVHVRQILFYNADDARIVLNQLQNGADFNDLAMRYDPNTHGELGWFPKGYLLDPQVEQVAFSLQVGQYSDVIQTEAGFHIIKVLERDAQHPLSPDAYLAMQELALEAWLAQQRTQAAILLAP